MSATTDEPDMTSAPSASVRAPARGHVIQGILAVGVASIIMRGGGLIGQFVAGWKLSEHDFGLFAVTLAFSTLAVASLSSLRPLFIERLTKGDNVDDLWRGVLFGLTGLAVAIAALSGPLAQLLGDPDAQPVLLVMAPTLPLQFAQIIGLARLAAEHRFTESSKILTISALARHGTLVVFALLGFGVYSLVLPLYFEAAAQAVLLWRAAGPLPSLRGPVSGLVAKYGRTLPWLGLSAVALAASLNGDYIAIKPFETTVVVGLYFFGYQLSAAITQPFTMAATNVLVPSFASVTERDRLQRSFIDAISVLLLLTGLAFGGLAIVGGPLIDLGWDGKWNEAIVATVLISAGTPLRILQPTCYSLLQSMGQWRHHSQLMTMNAIAAVGAAAAGAAIGGLFEIALLVSIAGGVVGTVVCLATGRHIDLPPSTTLTALVRGATPAAIALVAAFGYAPALVPETGAAIVRVLIYLVTGTAATLFLFRTTLLGMLASVRSTKRG